MTVAWPDALEINVIVVLFSSSTDDAADAMLEQLINSGPFLVITTRNIFISFYVEKY